MRWKSIRLQQIFFLLLIPLASPFNRNDIKECARVLSEHLVELFDRSTFAKDIPRMYEPYMEAEQFDPRVELRRSKGIIEKYMEKRAKDAFDAKVSLESRTLANLSDDQVNDANSQHFIRYMSAKAGTDATTVYSHDHFMRKQDINATRVFNMTLNANFYQLSTSSIASAVHIPTPLYNRNPELLVKIQWSDIDKFYRAKREETRDLAFQMFCSESGFMRYYPAASWYWDNDVDQLDLFDCRNTEWYINGATRSKNIIIMLDLSGSMLGQRYEIAKQTTETILETLSHNDYFNIMAFSKNVEYLDDCKGAAGLLQATMRNKKILRERMDNVTSEGKAEYEKALAAAFSQLLGLPPVSWTTREALALNSHNYTDAELIHLSDFIMIAPPGYKDMIINATDDSLPNNPGCENVIMLITDGAPQTYEEIFKMYNHEKKVRFFSFLIGEEAIDFDQVKWMACHNRGYMVHIANMADVEEKVQKYIQVMSRPVGEQAAAVKQENAFWSGVYRERLYLPRPEKFAMPTAKHNRSYHVMNMMAAKRKIHVRRKEARGRMFVTTVSYPVAVDGEFMGVAAVNIPLTEISQLAAPMMIGGRSYYFMLDRHGFVMFHPQLRQIDPATKFHKSNYNNMDILELEVPANSQAVAEGRTECINTAEPLLTCISRQREEIRKAVMDCDNSDPQEMDMLFASETLDRIYPQTNTYYTECVGATSDFVLGLALAKGDDFRIKAKGPFDYGNVDPAWVEDLYWKIHPHWRYCLLNDTDTTISKEEGFAVYIKFMRDIKALPDMCKPRQRLVDRMLWDIKATAPLHAKWQTHEEHMQQNEVTLIFYSSPTGFIRYHNISLRDFEYSDPSFDVFNFLTSNDKIHQETWKYQHFIADTNRKSVDDRYYRRAIRNDGVIVFDVNYFSKIWYKGEKMNPFGVSENVSMLFSAYRTIYLNQAILGVTGMEMGYDALVGILSNHGCQISDDSRWCVLLDEHGYVFYSNIKEATNYENFYRPEGDKYLGKWFGKINRVSQRAMELLVKKGFYKRYQYADHQATCKIVKVVTMGASRVESWLRSVIRLILSTILTLLKRFEAFTAFGIVHNWVAPIEAYTASFHDMRESFACSKVSPFYFANRKGANKIKSHDLEEGGKSVKPCLGAEKCSIKMQATFVENTNLIMVWMIQDPQSKNCYDDTQCPLSKVTEVPFDWERVSNSTRAGYDEAEHERCKKKELRRPSSKTQCLPYDKDEAGMPCSGLSSIALLPALATVVLRLLL